jgi:hypothetical protein
VIRNRISFDVIGRLGISCTVTPLTKNKFKIDNYGQYGNFGLVSTDARHSNISYFTFTGGPTVSLNTKLNSYHSELPDKPITEMQLTVNGEILITTK